MSRWQGFLDRLVGPRDGGPPRPRPTPLPRPAEPPTPDRLAEMFTELQADRDAGRVDHAALRHEGIDERANVWRSGE